MKTQTKILLFSLILFGCIDLINAQNQEIELWKNGIPGAIDDADYQEINDIEKGRISQVITPTLRVFVPEQPNGTSVIICAGGGYARLAISKESYKISEWLNSLGITAFVLKYRLPSDKIMKDKSIGPLQDAQEAVRYLRRHASKWNLNTDQIGIMGFSAGGHLAASLSTLYKDKVYEVTDSISARPNFSVLVYPVISMSDEITHKGSRKNLLGKTPSKEAIQRFSTEKQVNASTPPAFLVHAMDDKAVVVENSIQYALALKENNIDTEVHLYQEGGHGFGMGYKGTVQNWPQQCEAWLRLNEWID